MSGFCYEDMVQKALLGVVKEALKEVEKNGFLGDHHFYISYRTDFPGVEMPDYLREKHPHEIMVVMQYQYENLVVKDDHFSVRLSFNGKPEYLRIPYSAIVAFVDPSVKFGLQFSPVKNEPEEPTKMELPSEDNIIRFENFRKK